MEVTEAILDRCFDVANGPALGSAVARERTHKYVVQACTTALFVLERSVRLYRHPDDVHFFAEERRIVVRKWIEAECLLRHSYQAVLLMRHALATGVFNSLSDPGAIFIIQLGHLDPFLASSALAELSHTAAGEATRRPTTEVCEVLNLHFAVMEELRLKARQ